MTLKDYLSQNRLPLAEFGARIGVSHEAVRRYAAGLRVPRTSQMEAIVRETGGQVTPNDFFAQGRAA